MQVYITISVNKLDLAGVISKLVAMFVSFPTSRHLLPLEFPCSAFFGCLLV